MDSTKEFTVLEWCTGYAGTQLGLKRVIPNMRTVAYSEIEAFPCSNLVAKMEAGALDVAPIWADIKTFPCDIFRGKVDCLVAGYPCQPFSAVGRRQGAEDSRHLWPSIRNAIKTIRPRYCFFENVEGHISLGLSTVISDLAEDGYRTTWGIFSAEECGAPHRRKRVFILSKLDNTEPTGLQRQYESESRPQGRQESIRPITEASVPPLQNWPARPNEIQHEWEPPRTTASECKVESEVGRNGNGYSGGLGYAELCEANDNRIDELRLLGNGVVPATVAVAWETLYRRLN